MKRLVWFSDCHLNLSVLPFLKRRFITRLQAAQPDGLILTGDISTGQFLERDLRFLARHFGGPIYFVLGNHDVHARYIASVHADIHRLCNEYRNLIWMTAASPVSLTPDVALVGTEGWYDAQNGDPGLLRWSSDWYLTADFRQLPDHAARVDLWRAMAQDSADLVTQQLNGALANHTTVYVMTHVPPWKEATRAVGTWAERYWLPYNTNTVLGQAIERVMYRRTDKRVIVLAGHTHSPCQIRVTDNIDCMVARASYWGQVRPEETIVV